MNGSIIAGQPLDEELDWLWCCRDEGTWMIVKEVGSERWEEALVPGLIRLDPLGEFVTEHTRSVVPTTRIRVVGPLQVDLGPVWKQDHWTGALLVPVIDPAAV